MTFRLVLKSVTLNDLERRNGRYFVLFQRIPLASKVHCLKVHAMSSCIFWLCCEFGCQYKKNNWLSRLRVVLLCVEWDVKHQSFTDTDTW